MQADTLILRTVDWITILRDRIAEYEEDRKREREEWIKETMPLIKEHINKLTSLLESLRNGTIPDSLEDLRPQSPWSFPPDSYIHDERLKALEAYNNHVENDVCISLKEYNRLLS